MLDVLYEANGAVILLIVLVLISAAAEAGFRLGWKNKSVVDDSSKAQITVVEGALIGVFGLLLGFTMSMAVSRFEARRQVIVQEANAIGTAWLRTQLLGEPGRREIANLLEEYVDVRVLLGADDNSRRAQEELHRKGKSLQDAFWSLAVDCAQKDPNPVKAGLLLQSLNESIDLEETRWMAFQNHVPSAVIYVNVITAVVAVVLLAYSFGVNGCRRQITMWSFIFVIITALGVVIDLDQPHRGVIRVGQTPMIELQRELRSRDHRNSARLFAGEQNGAAGVRAQARSNRGRVAPGPSLAVE